MVKSFQILVFAIYMIGTLCLPFGDSDAMKHLPEMYRHCKTIEDKDMTPIDFITDHLVNFDGLFDNHNNGDGQKPHSATASDHHVFTAIFYTLSSSYWSLDTFILSFCKTQFIVKDATIFYRFKNKVYRPPNA